MKTRTLSRLISIPMTGIGNTRFQGMYTPYLFAIAAADAVGSALSAVQLAAARESIVPVIAAAITAQRGQGVGTCQKNVLNDVIPYIAVLYTHNGSTSESSCAPLDSSDNNAPLHCYPNPRGSGRRACRLAQGGCWAVHRWASRKGDKDSKRDAWWVAWGAGTSWRESLLEVAYWLQLLWLLLQLL